MTTLNRSNFSIFRLIESQMRGSNPADAKQERGLIEMLRQRYPASRDRASVPLPDAAALRDLQLTTGDISGANLARAVSNPLVQLAGAARPPCRGHRWCHPERSPSACPPLPPGTVLWGLDVRRRAWTGRG